MKAITKEISQYPSSYSQCSNSLIHEKLMAVELTADLFTVFTPSSVCLPYLAICYSYLLHNLVAFILCMWYIHLFWQSINNWRVLPSGIKSSASQSPFLRNMSLPSSRLKSKQSFIAACFMLISCLAYYSALEMVETYSSKRSVDFQCTKQHHILENIPLHNHCCENLQS
jgi:hypothetical protein